jgi:2,3-bisphosphoglycerate-independent phosphoglycerate mutase
MAKLVYVLLDGIGDLPHPDLNDLTPLEAAYTPNMDMLARSGTLGRVYSVGRGIAPQSDIAVLSMLGYRFKGEEYVGRGVIESIGSGIDFRDGDLAMRGNFATIDSRMNIIDRRVGRSVERHEAVDISKAIQEGVKLSNGSFVLVPTVGHRVVLRIRADDSKLSTKISNTDPAYITVKGMGIARPTRSKLKVARSKPLKKDAAAKLTASLVNEFTAKSIQIMREHKVNKYRRDAGKLEINCILLRDAGNRMPSLQPMSGLHGMNFGCIVDMPVEIGIAKVTGMRAYGAGSVDDYEQKGRMAARCLEENDAVYVHIKGPDEFGHDGDAKGKKRSIEDIDRRFFGTLLNLINIENVAVAISGDHSTPCIKKGHSDDPVPLLVSGRMVKNDGLGRFIERYAKKGALGLLQGYQVVETIKRAIIH